MRKRSAAVINDDLLIDLGPDIEASSLQHGIPLIHVRYCLQTHSHPDHFDPGHLLSRSPEYGVAGAPCLHFYASPGTVRQVAAHFQGFYDTDDLLNSATGTRLNLAMHTLVAWKPTAIGPYRVTAIPTSHDLAVESMLYAIEADGYGVFYGTDADPLPEDTWQGMHRLDLRFDIVVLDHTYGPAQPHSDHLGAEQVTEHVARMRAEGLLKETGRALATHISHEGNPPHPELADYAAAHGYEVAYDGLTL